MAAYVLIYDSRRWVRSDSTDVTIVLPLAAGGTGNASGTATVNANLTGPITSTGNATAVASQTGTGSTFAMKASPVFNGLVDIDQEDGGLVIDSGTNQRYGIIKTTGKGAEFRWLTAATVGFRFRRITAGTLLVPTADSVVFEIDNAGNLSIAGIATLGAPITLKGYTVATLPAGVVGYRAYVTDALGPAYGAVVVGGGAVVTPVFFNGAAWITA